MDPNEESAQFLYAAENNFVHMLEDMMKGKADSSNLVNVKDEDNYTPLHRACYNGHCDAVSFLLSHGANIRARTVDGWEPLHSAVRWNNYDVVLLLIENGADVNATTNSEQTVLHIAASIQDSKQILETLLNNKNIKPDLKNNIGETAYQVCRRSNNFYYLFETTDESGNTSVPK